jgi:hypothetical protein
MLNKLLAGFYERDLRQLIEEINLFEHEADLWRTAGTINNSAGNLVLHLTGGMNHLIGATLAHSGYIRNRELEFSQKNVPGDELVAGLTALITLICETLNKLSGEQMDAVYPIFFDQPGTTTAYVLMQLALHLNYHLGQVNYLRRMLSQPSGNERL